MIGRAILNICVCLGCICFVSCAALRDPVVDSVAGFPASALISDVKSAVDEHEEEKQKERVDELSQEYEEFLRSQETDEAQQEETKQSVVIKRENGKHN